jgi:hypothetical protein
MTWVYTSKSDEAGFADCVSAWTLILDHDGLNGRIGTDVDNYSSGRRRSLIEEVFGDKKRA